MSDPFEDEMKGQAGGDLSENLRRVHSAVKSNAAAPGEPQKPDKGGRRPGSKVVIIDGKKVVVPPDEMKKAAERVDDPFADVLSDENFKYFLNPICDVVEGLTGSEITKEERGDGAKLHASVMRNHAPDWLKKYSDIALCLGWWAGIGMKAGLAGKALYQTGNPDEQIQKTGAPEKAEPRAEAPKPGTEAPAPGRGFRFSVSQPA